MNRALILVLALGGCATTPPPTVAGHCRHLTAYADLYRSCATSVAAGYHERYVVVPDAPTPVTQTYTSAPRTLSTSPPAAPGPMPIPNRDTPRATTWMDTPYAPQVMPVWRGTPVP